jgi:serine/threonine protein kinase
VPARGLTAVSSCCSRAGGRAGGRRWGGKFQHVEIERDVLVANRSFPFIVSLRYAFQDDKYAYLCLDLAENGSLRAVLESSPGFQLELQQVRLYVAEVTLALECLHGHDIIYRDLKPENVLLGRDGHVTLADMGLAGFYYQDKYNDASDAEEPEGVKANDEAEMGEEDDALFRHDSSSDDENRQSRVGSRHARKPEQALQGAGAPGAAAQGAAAQGAAAQGAGKRVKNVKSHSTDCGTPLYRPPEMILHDHYNEGVDWFMLGVFTYECICGRLPFQPKNNQLVSDSGMIEIETDEQELRLLRRRVELPPHLDAATTDLLGGLLDLNPATRLGFGPEELKRDLAALKAHSFFVPLAGPLAKGISWERVLKRGYQPVFVPPEKDLEERPRWANFEALVKTWKKEARKEAQNYAKRKKLKVNYDIQALTEGKKLDKKLDHYFDNWDFIDPESINLERAAERRSGGDAERPQSIRKDLSRSIGKTKEKVMDRITHLLPSAISKTN